MQQIQTSHYPIHFGDEALVTLNNMLEVLKPSKVFFLVDSNTLTHCLPLLMSELSCLPKNSEVIEIEPGEINKTIETCTEVWLALSELGADRKSLLINVGGGVVTDMGGFIASCFKRGIKFINIPTTLLSQVDASVGGKTGIDLEGMKNQIGTFSQPEMVMIHHDFLETLDQRQLVSGFAEMLKHGLIVDKKHWENVTSLTKITPETVSPFIYDSVMIKRNVTEEDPFEQGLRKILNFGHTIGHAVESYFLESEEPLLHGEAIAVGMICETFLSYENELIGKADLNTVVSCIKKHYPLTKISPDIYPNLLEWMGHDKKNEANVLNFSLINGLGSCRYNINCSNNQILKSLDFYNTIV